MSEAKQKIITQRLRPRKKAAPKPKRPNMSVRPSVEELHTLHERAASFGYKSLSKYLIERGLREGVMIQSMERERLERLLFEVRRIGVNINQIALQMNRGYAEYSQARLDKAFREAERVHRALADELEGGLLRDKEAEPGTARDSDEGEELFG